jgi:hypothetical protein
MKMTTPREKDIQRVIVDWLRLHGAWVVRVNGGAVKIDRRFIRFSDTIGCPDVLFCLGGRFCAAEIKRPGGKLRPAQGECIDAINRAGGVAFVATSVDDVVAALRREGLLVM